MLAKFFNWTRLSIVVGILASLLVAVPVQAGGIQSNPIDESASFVAPPRPVLLSPAKGALVKNLTPVLKWKDNGAHYYRIQVASDNIFLNLVKDDIFTRDQIIAGILYAPTLPPGKRLFWRVQGYSATDEPSPWSPVWNIRTPLLSPTLVSPTNTEPLLIDRPTFVWNAASNATLYRLQASVSPNFSTLLVNVAVDTTQYTVPQDLPQNRTIYWRVRGRNTLLAGPWSLKWSFKTGNPPSVPVLISPANAALVRDFEPLFNWNNSTTPTGVTIKHYELQVDDNNDFSSLVIEETVTVSEFQAASALPSETKFFWRVRAIGTHDISGLDHTSGWSPRWSFTTSIPTPTSFTMIPGATNVLQPSFDWDDSTGTAVSGYTIQVSTKADFSTLIINVTKPTSVYAMTKDLPANKPIYVRVRANGTNGPSAWATLDFTIVP